LAQSCPEVNPGLEDLACLGIGVRVSVVDISAYHSAIGIASRCCRPAIPFGCGLHFC
jgi:hypothetical protein